jgi:hypothetical protein
MCEYVSVFLYHVYVFVKCADVCMQKNEFEGADNCGHDDILYVRMHTHKCICTCINVFTHTHTLTHKTRAKKIQKYVYLQIYARVHAYNHTDTHIHTFR